MKKNIILLAALSTLSLSMPVYAQSAAQIADMEKRFALADKDGDGKLTLEEAKDGMPRVFKNFSKIDVGGKGFVTVSDVKAAMAAMMGR